MKLPAFLTINTLHHLYAGGLRPADVISTLYQRIAAVSDPGIFIALLPQEQVLKAAEALGPFDTQAKPLWGVPFAVKDNIDVAGVPTTAACPGFTYTPGETAFAVRRLLDAGALMIGKTNLDQFATGLVGVRTPYPVPRNACDAAYVPGGSSSGSAVAVAHGLVTFALGTDTAGSGRVPAALNNIVGLKPSLGSVSSRGVVPACKTLDTLSVFAGSVEDADAVYRVAQAFDAAESWSRPLLIANRPGSIPPGLRLGMPDAAGRKFGGDALSEAAFDAALDDLSKVMDGKAPAAIDMAPLFEVANLLYSGPWIAERYHAVRGLIESAPNALHPTTLKIISGARGYSASDVFDGLYKLSDLRRKAEALWKMIDVLVVPTFPRPRTLADLQADPVGPNSELGTYTNFVNLLDLCALAVPARFRSDGFPSGVTLIAPPGQDGLLTEIGSRLHAAANVPIGATGMKLPPAPEFLARAAPGEIELAVVGAHLSGMALNHELTSRGARFLRAGPTAPDYRLYALAGGPPARPGLMRVAAGTGYQISTEVWALTPEALGSFMTGVPSPLGIGTTLLADGTTPKGFIVETEGIAGARDISEFGGWRNFINSNAA